MRKTSFIVGLHAFAIVAIIVLSVSGHQVFAAITMCDSGSNMSYDQAKDAIASGELVISQNPDLSTNRVTITVTNHTPCSVPVSLGSYKMFGPYSLSTQSQQEFFDGSPTVNVVAGAVETLGINLPTCAAQYDIWYGNVLHVLIDNQPYADLLTGDQVRFDQYCVIPPPPPVQATLHIIKHVINDDGGTAIASAFNLRVKLGGIDVSGSPAAGVESPGTAYILGIGAYVVSEDVWTSFADSYVSSFSGDCDAFGNITITDTNNKTCIITNNDVTPLPPPPDNPPPDNPPPDNPPPDNPPPDNPPPEVFQGTIHVIKHVVNDNGGTLTAAQFNLHLKSSNIDVFGSPTVGTEFPGISYTVPTEVSVGTTYIVSEDVITGYTSSFSGDCDAFGVITLMDGNDKTCTITNNDIAPPPITTATLHIIKVVVNDNNGTATPSTFNLHVKTSNIDVSGSPTFGTSSPGTLYTLAANTYVVNEDANTLYTQSFSGDCDVNGVVSLGIGDNKICTITNNDVAPVVVNVVATTTSTVVLTSVVTVSSGGGGGGGGTSGPCRGFNCPVSGTVTLATEYIPSFPNTGLSPRWESLLWSITIMAGILLSIMISLNVILKKRSV